MDVEHQQGTWTHLRLFEAQEGSVRHGAQGKGGTEPAACEEEQATTALNRERALTNNLMEQICERENLNRAYKRVKANRGAPGVDGMTVQELYGWITVHKEELVASLLNGSYEPQPVRGQAIPKPRGGERQLGIPTVVDRLVQQAILQVLPLSHCLKLAPDDAAPPVQATVHPLPAQTVIDRLPLGVQTIMLRAEAIDGLPVIGALVRAQRPRPRSSFRESGRSIGRGGRAAAPRAQFPNCGELQATVWRNSVSVSDPIRARSRRWYVPDATYFIVGVTQARQSLFLEPENVSLLRETLRRVKEYHLFRMLAYVFLPDHFHVLFFIPETTNVSKLRQSWPRNFTLNYKAARGMSRPLRLWQRGFWDHVIRDDLDYAQHIQLKPFLGCLFSGQPSLHSLQSREARMGTAHRGVRIFRPPSQHEGPANLPGFFCWSK